MKKLTIKENGKMAEDINLEVSDAEVNAIIYSLKKVSIPAEEAPMILNLINKIHIQRAEQNKPAKKAAKSKRKNKK